MSPKNLRINSTAVVLESRQTYAGVNRFIESDSFLYSAVKFGVYMLSGSRLSVCKALDYVAAHPDGRCLRCHRVRTSNVTNAVKLRIFSVCIKVCTAVTVSV